MCMFYLMLLPSNTICCTGVMIDYLPIGVCYILMSYLQFCNDNTVVPATAGPLGERPPALAGHFCDVPTTLPC